MVIGTNFRKPTDFPGYKAPKAPLLRGFFRLRAHLESLANDLDSEFQRRQDGVTTGYSHGMQLPNDFSNKGVGLGRVSKKPS